MRVLLTGANGFIGRRIAELLLDSDHEVVCTGRQATGRDLPGAYVQGDLSRPEDCARVVQSCEAVIHCAGKAGAWGDWESYHRANVVATENLLQASRNNGVRRFLNLSSPSIYFDYRHQFDLREDQLPPHFSNAYAATKYEAEQCVRKAHDSKFWTVSFRPRGVIGAGDRNWLPRIIEMREQNRLLQIGDGKNKVDFTSVSNLAHAIKTVLEADASVYGRVYNISNGKPEFLWEIIESALEAVGLDGKRRHLPLAPVMGWARLSERFHQWRGSEKEPTLLPIKVGVAAYSMTLNIDAARSAFAYAPQKSTSEAVQEFAHWWRDSARN